MKQLRDYIINFGNLKLGKHQFEFTADDNFFENFEYSLVKKGNVAVNLELEKQKETLLILNFRLKGHVVLTCDRCLDEFEYPVESKHRLIIKLEASQEKNDDDELIFLPADAYQVDVSLFIYEFITLALPLRRLCELAGKECNQQMLDYLQDVNEHEGEKGSNAVDPRWEKLKNIKNDNKNE